MTVDHSRRGPWSEEHRENVGKEIADYGNYHEEWDHAFEDRYDATRLMYKDLRHG